MEFELIEAMKIKGVSIWIWLFGGVVTLGAIASAVSVAGKGNSIIKPPAVERIAIPKIKRIDAASPKEEQELSSALSKLKFGMKSLKLGIHLEYLTGSIRDQHLKDLEEARIPGKVAIIERKLKEEDEELKQQTEKNKVEISDLNAAIERGRKITREGKIQEEKRLEFEAWANHCEQGIAALQQWKRDMMVSASKLSLANTLWQINGDYDGYVKAAKAHEALVNEAQAKWIGPPEGY